MNKRNTDNQIDDGLRVIVEQAQSILDSSKDNPEEVRDLDLGCFVVASHGELIAEYMSKGKRYIIRIKEK